MISDNMINLVKKFEGLELEAYFCPAGLKTIGYGHVVKEGENLDKITPNIAEELLVQDLSITLSHINKLIYTELGQNQLDALASFTFNLGANALQRSTLRQMINREDFLLAGNEFLKWIYCKGLKLPGLLRRRKIEREIFLLNL